MPLTVERRHPDYKEWSETASFLWTSYVGGRLYKEADMLDKYPLELEVIHEGRKEP